jgi:hypothetical protein
VLLQTSGAGWFGQPGWLAPDSLTKRIYASTDLLLRRNGNPSGSVLAVQMVIYEKTIALRDDVDGRAGAASATSGEPLQYLRFPQQRHV